jgi:hypothetical protein
MRRLHISIVISLLLLLAQQGAVLHEMSHIVRAGVSGADVAVQADSALEKTCELCLAFSQVANPAGHSITVPMFEPTACAAGSNPFRAAAPAAIPTPRSRGPPTSALNS